MVGPLFVPQAIYGLGFATFPPARSPMHANSIAAHQSIDISTRERQVLDALARLGGRSTDRAIAREMGSEDPNISRPRVSRLVQDGILRECDHVVDTRTGRTVRVVERVL